MTLADHRTTPRSPASPAAAPHAAPERRRSPREASAPPSSARRPKPPLDVADLLLMSSFGTATDTLPANPADAGDLLDFMVEDHLSKASESAVADPPPKAPAADALLQREIDALLNGAPESPAPLLQPSLVPAADAPSPISVQELDALLSTSAENALQADPSPATAAAPGLDDDGESKLLEAEGVLAEELQQLMEGAETPAAHGPAASPLPVMQTAPAVDAAATDPDSTNATPATSTAPAAAFPIVNLATPPAHADQSEGTTGRYPRGRLTGLFADVALVAAQVADMPFRWMDVMDKNLLGVAAAIMLLSGIVLKAFAWWMGIH